MEIYIEYHISLKKKMDSYESYSYKGTKRRMVKKELKVSLLTKKAMVYPLESIC